MAGPVMVRWAVMAMAVWVADYLVPGISHDGLAGLLVAALVLGFLNAFVRPLLVLLTLPFVLLSLGVFLVIINAFLLSLTAVVVPGFEVATFFDAVLGALIISTVNLLVNPGPPKVEVRRGPGRLPPRDPPPGQGPVIDV